ncbi:3-dehydroquinate synthase [Bacillus aquiflavi]|uniref:3-dehydroquinate synthase n=1 Tax=Bacillus aquiflavi TaxID=2672567 RepID=UPI001CA839E3|nr:3-dehydroquinate synthase [Bacillus aquiflavi]UAC47071.1 3-dehydroquinate synthase [Bacillus aquiflavi]
MKTIKIETGSKQYFVKIGIHVLNELLPFINEKFPHVTKIFIITDETVGKLHLTHLMSHLQGKDSSIYTVPSGEKAKTFNVYYDCLTYALEQKLDRKSHLLAFGGGAVGDLAGFVAATFMRGIPFIQIPTTILAHDSAVGGKVALNHPLGKNMIGAFHQPEAVFFDLSFIQSLPIREVRSGFAEVVKHALIKDKMLYETLFNSVASLDKISNEMLEYALTRGIEIKGSIVAEDEKEIGVRAFLNFGHTLGHAIEAEAGYGVITHGEAVVIGMLFALQVSKEIAGLTFDYQSFKIWLESLNYQTSIPKNMNASRLIERMKQDKKSVGQRIRFILLKELGYPIIYELDEEYLLKKIEQF